MIQDFISGDYDSPNAPWNSPNAIYCPECSSEMEWFTGEKNWNEYICPECGVVISNEPDYE